MAGVVTTPTRPMAVLPDVAMGGMERSKHGKAVKRPFDLISEAPEQATDELQVKRIARGLSQVQLSGDLNGGRPDGHERRSQSHAQAEVRGPPEPDVTASHPADAHAPGEAEPVAADSGADVTAWDIYREINDILRHLHLERLQRHAPT